MIAARQIAFGRSAKKEETPAYWGLCFTAEEAGSTVAMAKRKLSNGGSVPKVTLETSYDGKTWEPFYVGDTVVTLYDVGDKVYFRAGEAGNMRLAGNPSIQTYAPSHNHFVLTGLISATGSINSLLNGMEETLSLNTFAFAYLFWKCSSLTTAPELPAEVLSTGCYRGLFNGCTSLVNAPELPATTLKVRCYQYMFSGCTSLVNAPELPATTLEANCYTNMFSGCTSLVNAPELPATTLATNCYQYMFNGCTSLVNAPELPATTLEASCYPNMFSGCTSLVNAPELPATTLEANCYTNMFSGCEKVSLISTRQTSFTGCADWLSGVAQSGTFYCPTSLGMDETITRGASACPEGWTVINED